MDVRAEQTDFTIDDIYALPEGERAELINGKIFMMAPPKTSHQRILQKLCLMIGNYIDSKKGNCEVFPAPFAVFLNEDDKNYVEPDISVVCDKSKLDERGCNGAPDWIIEITSPSTKKMDYMIKLFKYRSCGVKEYWIVDYEINRILVYDFAHDTMGDYTFSDVIKAGIYEDLVIDFSECKLKQ